MANTQAQLDQLEQAKIDLLSGKMKVELRYADKTVKYAATDLAKLDEAIAQCKAKLAEENGGSIARRHGHFRPGI